MNLNLFSHLTVTVYFKMKYSEGKISRTWTKFHLCLCCEFVSLTISAAIMSKDSRIGMKFEGVLIKRPTSGTSYEEQI